MKEELLSRVKKERENSLNFTEIGSMLEKK